MGDCDLSRNEVDASQQKFQKSNGECEDQEDAAIKLQHDVCVLVGRNCFLIKLGIFKMKEFSSTFLYTAVDVVEVLSIVVVGTVLFLRFSKTTVGWSQFR